MKIKSLLSVIILGMFLLAACSQCYECSYYVEVDTNDDLVPDDSTLNTEEHCTTSQAEISQREEDGESCKAI